MDLRQLAALVAVAETGTFSAAADVLHTVQSNVSTHIARLERELGVTLVDRAAGRLTEEGVAAIVVEAGTLPTSERIMRSTVRLRSQPTSLALRIVSPRR